jgi:hypothetical protein
MRTLSSFWGNGTTAQELHNPPQICAGHALKFGPDKEPEKSMSFPKPSNRALMIGAMMSATGGLTAVAMFLGFRSDGSNLLKGEEIPVAIVAIIGAFLAGLITSPAFGRNGKIGLLLALVGAIGATATGAFFGGLLLFQTVDEAIICTVMLGISIVTSPLITGLPWLLMMGTVHGAALVFIPKAPADLDLIPGPNNL